MTTKAKRTAAGELLHAARLAEKMSQEDAAARMGMSTNTWGNLERGYQYLPGSGRIEYRSPAETWIRAARAVKADPAAVLKAAGYDPAEYAEELAATPEEKPAVVIVGVREGATRKEIEEAVQRVFDQMS